MPIYAYKCSTCGFAKDALQKMSDAPLTVCPECGASTFEKQVTAAGFQLKGSGWYVTDFRDGGGKKPGEAGVVKSDDKKEKPGGSESGASGSSEKSAPSEGGASTPAAAPAPAAAPSAAPAASPAPAAKKD